MTVGFCRDIGCGNKLTKKIEKYSPLIASFKRYCGRVKFVAIPIADAGPRLQRTVELLTTALSALRLLVEQTRDRKGITDPAIDSNARSHDHRLFNSLLASLTEI